MHAEAFARRLSKLVQPLGVFIRAEGEGGAKPLKAVFLRRFRRGVQPQLVATVTAPAPLGFFFQASGDPDKRGRVVIAVEKLCPARLFQKAYLLRLALQILRLVPDIRIIIKYGQLKMLL